jgi:uncharacterized damage-inducible protein DinB
MLLTIEELVRHKNWANTSILQAIQQQPAAEADDELRNTLHHILVANRFWLFTILGRPFDRETEMLPATFAELVARFQETEEIESQWLSTLSEPELERMLLTRTSRLGIDVSVRHAILQVCMHTQGHRAQCAARWRALGGIPPGTDYVLWIKNQGATR